MNSETNLPSLSVEPSLPESKPTYRQLHHESIRASEKRSYQRHREERRAAAKARYEANREKEIARKTEWVKKNPEKAKQGFKDWANRNKAKRAAYAKRRYHANPEKALASKRRQYVKHREERLAYQAEWRRKNPDKLKAGQDRYFQQRMATDPAYRLRHQLRSHIRILLAKQDVIKSRKTLDLLGCTSQFWKEYLTAKFLPGMTWENYGTDWHIDHIIPLSKFDLFDVEQQKRAFHYSNTRPLWKPDNRNKSDSMPGPHQALLI